MIADHVYVVFSSRVCSVGAVMERWELWSLIGCHSSYALSRRRVIQNS